METPWCRPFLVLKSCGIGICVIEEELVAGAAQVGIVFFRKIIGFSSIIWGFFRPSSQTASHPCVTRLSCVKIPYVNEKREMLNVGENGKASMTLDALEVGACAIIDGVNGSGELRRHLLDMGLTPGVGVRLRKVAPMGDPLQVELRGYELTLRVSDAQQVAIAPVDELPALRMVPRPLHRWLTPGIRALARRALRATRAFAMWVSPSRRDNL